MRYLGAVLIFLIFLLIMFVIPPFYNFPLNDDWAHAYSVKYFLENHEIRISDWSPMSLMFQISWGSLFSFIFGFSFGVLRLSTIILSLVGAFSFYFLLREFDFSEIKSVFGSLLLLFNPIFFNLTYTFMTDVPFITMMVLSILFFVKAIKKNNDYYLTIGTAFSAISFLIRQNGILISLGIFVYYLLNRKKLTKKIFLIITLIPVFTFVIFYYWYNFIHGPTLQYIYSTYKIWSYKNNLLVLFLRVAYRSFHILEYLGLFLIPLLLGCIPSFKKIIRFDKITILCSFVILLGVVIAYFFSPFGEIMPYTTNIINTQGLGPTEHLQGTRDDILPSYIWKFITALSSISAIVFFISIFQIRKDITSIYTLIYLIGLLQFANILLTPAGFDRYIVVLLPIVIILFLDFIDKIKISKIWILMGLIVFGFFSITGTLDYLNWNNAKWEGTQYLLKEGISPNEIDGGFEFNGWYLYDDYVKNLNLTTTDEKKDYLDRFKKEIEVGDVVFPTPENKSWWFVVDDKYKLSFSEFPNYLTIKKTHYSTPFSLEGNYIYVLKRSE